MVPSETARDGRRSGGDKLWDDCGAWTQHHGWRSNHLRDSVTEVRVMDDGLYGTSRRVDGKRATVRIHPQPTDVLCVHRMYTKLARDAEHRRRITYVDGIPLYVAKYLGTFPRETEANGNAAKSTREYVRTRPAVLEAVMDDVKATKDKLRKVYKRQHLDGDGEGPRNIKQVKNAAQRVRDGLQSKSSGNLADEIQSLLTRMSSEGEDFVQGVQCLLRKSPSVVLFTNEQIDDLRTFCCGGAPANMRSVLAVDRTFNLSSLFVTVTVFRHHKVVRKSTQQAPIFLVPMMLHGDGKFATYLSFFSTLCGALNGKVVDTTEFRVADGVITGSDEESALVNALRSAFPQSQQLYCMLHCKDNVRHHLTSIGVPTTVREQVLYLLFGCSGVAEAGDEVQLNDRTAHVLRHARQQNVDTIDYLQQRVLPKIAGNCRLKWAQSWLGQHQWFNNNCESANHLLKMQVQRVTLLFPWNCMIRLNKKIFALSL